MHPNRTMNVSLVDEVLNFLKDNCYNASGGDEGTGKFCSAVFDGYLCWPETGAGKLAVQPCYNKLMKSTKEGLASRQCTENGTWLIPENHTDPWSNLTQCGNFFIAVNHTEPVVSLNPLYHVWIPILKNIMYFGYAISIISLVIALSIFVNIKKLHCPRNKLHINLFLSFILRSFMSIMKDGLFVKGTALSYDVEYIDGEPKFLKEFNYSWVCKAIISIRWYFILSNFMFILMEGVYLHNLIFLNLFSENHGVKIYCMLGWGLPIIFVVPWIVNRVLFEDVLCWTQKENSNISLIIELPIRVSVVINFVLFLIIIRVLVVKLNSACIQQRKIRYRKLLKATTILIPLFGVPYSLSLLMSLYIDKNHILELVWLFLDQTFAAFQGLFAALLYCLLNTEVRMEMKRKYTSMKDRSDKEFRRSRTISNTQQFCMQTMDEPENVHQNGNGNCLENKLELGQSL